MKHLEDSLQITCANYLRRYCPSVLFFHCPNGMVTSGTPRQRAQRIERFKRMGMLPGVADIILFWRNESPCKGAIELKAGKNDQTQAQSNFEQQWKHQGGQYAVCRSLEELESLLIAWGVIKITRLPTRNAMGSVSPVITKPAKKGAD